MTDQFELMKEFALHRLEQESKDAEIAPVPIKTKLELAIEFDALITQYGEDACSYATSDQMTAYLEACGETPATSVSPEQLRYESDDPYEAATMNHPKGYPYLWETDGNGTPLCRQKAAILALYIQGSRSEEMG